MDMGLGIFETSRILNLALYGLYAFSKKQLYIPINTALEVCSLLPIEFDALPGMSLYVKKKCIKVDVSRGGYVHLPKRKGSYVRRQLHYCMVRTSSYFRGTEDLYLTPWFHC